MRSSQSKDSQNLSDFLILRSSKWGHFRWIIVFLFTTFYTWFFWSLEEVTPGQKPVQLTFAFMVGLDMLLFLNLANSFYRQILIDDLGLATRFLFKPTEIIPYENITLVECWRGGGETIKFYIHQKIEQMELSIDSTTWKNVPFAIHFVRSSGNIPLVSSGLDPGRKLFKRAISIVLMALGISFTLPGYIWLDVLGFIIIRFFWAQFLVDQKPQDLRAMRLYLLFFALAVLLGLIFIAGKETVEIASWWLYSPAIDIAISYLYGKYNSRKSTS